MRCGRNWGLKGHGHEKVVPQGILRVKNTIKENHVAPGRHEKMTNVINRTSPQLTVSITVNTVSVSKELENISLMTMQIAFLLISSTN